MDISIVQLQRSNAPMHMSQPCSYNDPTKHSRLTTLLCVCVSTAAPDLHYMLGWAKLRSLAVAMLEIPSLLNQICLLVALGPRAILFLFPFL
jgi:hypothetical protein